MKLHTLPLVLLGTMGAIAFTGCKPKEAEPIAPSAVGAPAVPAASPTISAAAAATHTKPFDITSVPGSKAEVPPFPYLDLPKEAQGAGYHVENQDFDRTWVLAGEELRTVDGRTSERWFPLGPVHLSMLAAFRNYETAIKSMGGVKVNTVHPIDPAFVARNDGNQEAIFKKLGIPNSRHADTEGTPTFSQYLIRTPKENIWISLIFFDGDLNMSLKVVREEAMQQTVSLIKADTMAAALADEGHIALYLNFDNDSDQIRADSNSVIDEIAAMMAADPTLKIRVEGHTDNTGTAARNNSLSRARAEAVVKAITAKQIAADRLMAEGAGANRPLVDNRSEENRAKNRRVELVKL
jgi:OOP family OmpA-OmpF porin